LSAEVLKSYVSVYRHGFSLSRNCANAPLIVAIGDDNNDDQARIHVTFEI